MRTYLELLENVYTNGTLTENRTGIDAKSVFSTHMDFDLSNYKLPLLTTKLVHFRSVLIELLWFISGDTHLRFLKDHGVSIWDEWVIPGTEVYAPMNTHDRLCRVGIKNADLSDTDKATRIINSLLDKFHVPHETLVDGSLGPIYGKQWRSWGCPDGTTIDQLLSVQDSLRKDPLSRRHIVSSWNPADLSSMALPPCHCLFQFNVSEGHLNCMVYQRSTERLH